MATVKKVRKSAAPYYGAAAVWIAWAALRDLYRVSSCCCGQYVRTR